MPPPVSLLDHQLDEYSAGATARLTKGPRRNRAAKWTRFAAAAGASMAAAHVAEAAPIWVNPPDFSIHIDTSSFSATNQPFDLDGDGVDDFQIGLWRFQSISLGSTTTSSGGTTSYSYYAGSGSASLWGLQPGNGVLANASNRVRQLSSGATIGPGGDFQQLGRVRTVSTYFFEATNTIGTFAPGADGLAGVQFQIGGQTHYGWIRLQLDVSSSIGLPNQLTVRDWAYESIPGTAIAAGSIVPEPSTFGLGCLAAGAAGVAALRRRKKGSASCDC